MHMSDNTQQFSARFSTSLIAALASRADHIGSTRSRLAERYIAEGLRIDQHPGIVFRDGPAGRRAALIGGPDVWQVIPVVKASPRPGEPAITHAAKLLDLRPAQVRAAVSYYAAHQDEIDDRIKRNDDLAEEAEAAWRREQAALA